MITEFSIDRSFLESRYMNDESLAVLHDHFFQVWRDYGVLVVNQASKAKCVELVRSLPAKFQPKWLAAFSHLKVVTVDERWGELDSYGDFEEVKVLSNLFKTLFSDETAGFLVCGNEQLSRYCEETSFEIVSAPELTQSRNFQNSFLAASRDIVAAERIEDIWAQRFKKLAAYSKRVVVSDRYLFQRLITSLERGLASTSMSAFFRLITKEPGDFYITVISDGGCADSQFRTEIVNYLERLFLSSANYGRRIKSLTLVSGLTSDFQEHAHDRYIRFDEHVCALGIGMEVFEAGKTRNTTLSIKSITLTNVVQVERELRSGSAWHEVLSG